MALTIRVHFHFGPIEYEHFEYVQATRFGTIMQRSVAFDALFVDISFQGQQEVGDFVVAFVASDHQARVAVTVGYFDVCGNGKIRY